MSLPTNYVVLDVETTIKNKGSPFTKSNKLCWVGILDNEGYHEYDIEHGAEPYGEKLLLIRRRIESASLLIGFNLKFDLNWIKRYIPDVKFPDVYDCQLADFVLTAQRHPFASLNEVAARCGLGTKLDVVNDEYWSHGIDTTSVPKDVLAAYTKQDVDLTYQIFQIQRGQLKGRQKRNFWLDCQDLKILQEIEENGLFYDTSKARNSGLLVQQQLSGLDEKLRHLVPCQYTINFGSPAQLSTVLYGGSIDFPVRETVTRILKDGRESVRERWGKATCDFPRLVDPIDDDERSVAEPILKRLRAKGTGKKVIQLLLERARLKKLDSTYYTGLLDKYKEMEWEGDCLHGNFNQCAVVTGRLSSSRPNLQNFSGEIKELFYSRFVKDRGVLINADWKGLEWLAAIFLSGDSEGRREIIAGIDQHSENQRWLGFRDAANGRLLAKKFVFRLIYGGSAYAYANDAEFDSLGLSEGKWQRVIDRFYEKYRGLKEWHDYLVQEVMRSGKLTMPTGRVYTFFQKNGKWPRTEILNYPVQGFGADLMKLARIIYSQKLNQLRSTSDLPCLLVSTVHDSLLTDTVEELINPVSGLLFQTWDEVPSLFQRNFGVSLDLPVRVEVTAGPNWKLQEEIKRV